MSSPIPSHEYRWKVKDAAIPRELVAEFPEYHPKMLQLLYHRGIATKEAIEEFFAADYAQNLHDPFLMRDMDRAVERIVRAAENGEQIVIYGDYDADGVCASAVLYKFFREGGVPVDVYIPDRFKEGYGLNTQSVAAIVEGGANLIITVDCGITDFKEIAYCNERGVDVIVTDHHLALSELPGAYAILDPARPGETYPFQRLCGAGVAFKLVCALFQQHYFKTRIKEGFEKWLLDLVAIATVADIVPLLGENRVLVKYGLLVLQKTRWRGLSGMLQKTRLAQRNISSTDIAFILAPRLNAAGRMDHATISFELLNTDNGEETQALLNHLEEKNAERQALVKNIVGEIEAEIESRAEQSAVLFAGKDTWPSSVAGLVASKLTEKYLKPAFVYMVLPGGQAARGSCRSIGGFNLSEAMEQCRELLIEFGGHAAAAGFHVKTEHIAAFEKKMSLIYEEYKARAGEPERVLDIECELGAQEITPAFFHELEKMAPFGHDNEEPVFLATSMKVWNMRAVGEDKHTKMEFTGMIDENIGAQSLSAICFNSKEKFKDIQNGDNIDVVFTLHKNHYNGNCELFLKILDIKKSEAANV